MFAYPYPYAETVYSTNATFTNNNGNFICVFECTIVNLATYRQFTNAAWDWIIKKNNDNNNKQKHNNNNNNLTSYYCIDHYIKFDQQPSKSRFFLVQIK